MKSGDESTLQGNHHLRGVIITALSAVIFGMYPASAQRAYLAGANPTFVILVTTFFRAASLCLFCVLTKRPILCRGSAWRPMIVGGLFQALSIFGVIGSLAYLPAPITMTILFTHTIMLLLLLAFRGEAVLTPLVIGATLCALLGVSGVVGLWENSHGFSVVGLVLAFIAALATMIRLYVFGKEVLTAHPIVVGAQVFFFAFLFATLSIAFQLPRAPNTAAGFLWTLVASTSSVIGTFGTFYSIALIGSFQFSLTIKIEPIFTALFSFLILGQLLRPLQYVGMLLVIVSLISFQLFGKPPNAVQAAIDVE